MRRPLLALAVGLVPAGDAAAVGPQGPARTAVVMVEDARHRPVDGARGVLIADPTVDLPAIRGFPAADEDPAAALLWAQPSRQTGMLRWGFGDAPRTGGVLISAPDGLGALLPHLGPGDAHRVTLAPVGTIATPDGDPCVLYATATVGDRRLLLPPMQAAAFPLPAAGYEGWTVRGESVYWQRIELESGATVTLDLDGPKQVVERAAGARVFPSSRPDLELLGPERARVTLCGSALAAPLTAHVPATGLVVAERAIPGPARPEPIVWPPAETVADAATIEVELGFEASTGSAAARGFVLRRTASDRWLLLGAAVADDAGRLRLPAPSGGDDWLLVLADGSAPHALPLAEWRAGRALAIARGDELTVACRHENGDPADNVRLEFVPGLAEVATIAVRTDRRGRASFGRVGLPGRILASDPRYGNGEVAVAPGAAVPVPLALAEGATLRGVVRLPDGAPAAGATVTLRDPLGQLRPPARTVVADADGTFAFRGLTENARLTLFATQRREDRTWSSPLVRAAAGDTPAELTVQNEDPRLGPGR